MELLSVFSQTEELLCGVLGCAHSASVLQPNWRLFRLNISRLITVTLHRLSPLLRPRSNSSDLTLGWMFTANMLADRPGDWRSSTLKPVMATLRVTPSQPSQFSDQTLDTLISHGDNHTPHHILTYQFFFAESCGIYHLL